MHQFSSNSHCFTSFETILCWYFVFFKKIIAQKQDGTSIGYGIIEKLAHELERNRVVKIYMKFLTKHEQMMKFEQNLNIL